MGSDEPGFVRLQRAFVAHLRDPVAHPPPGEHEERRLAIYRHAIHFNVERLLRDNYPRIHAILAGDRWEALVHDYLVRHVARANVFVEVPLEFLAYLDDERADAGDPPFLRELAHFDWLETLVGAARCTVSRDGVDDSGDLLEGVPVLNPTLTLVTYRFPVHAIGPDYQPAVAPATPTRIAAFRDPDNRYGFLDLNAASARLLELARQRPAARGCDLVAAIGGELGRHDLPTLLAAGGTILARMRERGAILGIAR